MYRDNKQRLYLTTIRRDKSHFALRLNVHACNGNRIFRIRRPGKPEFYSNIILTRRCRYEKEKKPYRAGEYPRVGTRKTHLRRKRENNERDWTVPSEFRETVVIGRVREV